MSVVILRRSDPARNIHRYYRLDGADVAGGSGKSAISRNHLPFSAIMQTKVGVFGLVSIPVLHIPHLFVQSKLTWQILYQGSL